MNKHFRLALLAAASFGMPALAVTVVDEAGSTDPAFVQVHSVPVDVHSQDLRDPKAMQRLFFRIRQAAEEICRMSSHPVGYELWQERSCEAEAVAEAVRATGIPELNDYYFRGAPLRAAGSGSN